MDLSIIIVNYNTVELLDKALRSIKKYSPSYSHEVFVVDNASNDGSREYLKAISKGEDNKARNIRENILSGRGFEELNMDELDIDNLYIILNDSNSGFAAANNIAIKKASGRYVLLLNPDTEVVEDTLDKCIRYMEEHSEIGILGCKVLLPNGELDLACRRGFPNLKNSFFKFSGLAKTFPKVKAFTGYNLTHLSQNESYPVDSVVGAFMMLRREVIDRIGLLDEEFFMYGEDIDWCFRAKEAGWVVFYFADAFILHHKRASSIKSKKALVEFYRAMEIFYRKYYATNHNRYTNQFVYMSIKILVAAMIVMNNIRQKLR